MTYFNTCYELVHREVTSEQGVICALW